MQDATDMDLLRQYADRNSDEAFAALVSRHLNLVYSAALRKTGSPNAAQEITQAVFIILARKAGGLRGNTILSGWLYQTARLTAAGFLRTETGGLYAIHSERTRKRSLDADRPAAGRGPGETWRNRPQRHRAPVF